jgi:DnaJ-class molecular chaperone
MSSKAPHHLSKNYLISDETHHNSAGSTKDDTCPYYYKVLDVSADASPDEIKKAYRRLSILYHLDTSTDPDAEKKMKEINKAYDVLSDPDKRARYDNFENTFKG